jgi:hypothetical protein
MTARTSNRAQRKTPPQWQVLQYRSRGSNRWRVVYVGPERAARKRYLREHVRLRQGHLLLLSAEGKPVCHHWIRAAGRR